MIFVKQQNSNPAKYTRATNFLVIGMTLTLITFFSSLTYAQSDAWNLINPDSDWSGRAGLQAVSIGESFYIMGGRTPKPPTFPPIPGDSYIWNDVWKSDDRGLTWTNILDNDSTGNHWSARGYFQALTRNDSIYIMGGQNYKVVPNPEDSTLISLSDFFNDVWVSPDGISWQQLTDSAGWSGRAGLSSVVYKDEIYVMGGSINDDVSIIGGTPARIYYSDVWKSSDGINWVQLTDSAEWKKRAGGIAIVKDDYIYMIGGEEGFLCEPEKPCPPYFNDVWRTQDGINWELVTAEAEWQSRPGHQVVLSDNKFVLFGGFGIDTLNPFNPANPIDVWTSEDGNTWTLEENPPWNASSPTEIKYDFDALTAYDNESSSTFIYTFGGDRETFNFMDPTNYLNIDNDVWQFSISESASGLGENQAYQEVVASPNPFDEKITLSMETIFDKVMLYDSRGVLVHKTSGDINASAITIEGLSKLPSGIYMLRIKSGQRTFTKKLIKQ